MLRAARLYRLPVVILAGTASPAVAACPSIAIDGWNPAWNRSQCVQDMTQIPSVPNDSVHKRDNPSCDNNEQEVNATEIQNKFIDSIGASGGAAAGTALAGPIGGLVGAAAGKAAGDSIERIIRHNSAGGKSNCAALCVNVPPAAKNISVEGYAFPVPPRQYYTACDFSLPHAGNSFPGRCDNKHNGAWAAMTPPTQEFNPKVGTTICSTAKNWTDSFPRGYALRAQYDLP